MRNASLRFVYRVERGTELVAEGWTRHAVIDATSGRPRGLPDALRNVIRAR